MHKLVTLLTSVSILAVLSAGLSSCKDDEEPPSNATLSFSTTSKTVGEGEIAVKANIVLDKPAPTDLIVEYELSGSATRKIGSSANGDYELVGGSVGEVEIAEGETTGEVEFDILTDNVLEQDETIILELVDVSSPEVEIGTDDVMTITIEGGGSVTATFAAATMTVDESDEGLHEITVNISAAVAADLVVEYDLGPWLNNAGTALLPGVAIDTLRATEEELPTDYWDYYIDGVSGELTIPAGQTSGVIKFNVYSDFRLEDPETITLTLKDSDGVTAGAAKTMTVTIDQEDGKVIALFWPDETDVDMDLILYLKVDEEYIDIIYAAAPSTEGPEYRILPNAILEEFQDLLGQTSLEWGASYIYYSGSVNPLEFEVDFIDCLNGELEDSEGVDFWLGEYTLANLNPWDSGDPEESLFPTVIEQTFVTTDGTFSDISDITIPGEFSRPRTGTIKNPVSKHPRFANKMFQSPLK